MQVKRAEEDKVCDTGCRIGEPALYRPQKPAETRFAGPAVETPRRALEAQDQGGACAAVNVNGQYNMQDPNHWYSLQRSNAGQHAYSVQDSASNTPTLPPAGLHDNQALSPVYPFGSAMRPTQGESFSLSLDTNHLLYMPVSRHLSHLSMVAHSPSHAQPQYFNTNGTHSPSPNPPPYTEYATELNRPQFLRHQERESSYWPVGGDSSRYTEGQSNR